jgi:hypothetical protein
MEEFLIIAQEKFARLCMKMAEAKAATNCEELAAKVLSEYGTVSTSILDGIYQTVEKDFTDSKHARNIK